MEIAQACKATLDEISRARHQEAIKDNANLRNNARGQAKDDATR